MGFNFNFFLKNDVSSIINSRFLHKDGLSENDCNVNTGSAIVALFLATPHKLRGLPRAKNTQAHASRKALLHTYTSKNKYL